MSKSAALFKRMSMPPKRSTVESTMRWMSSRFVTSARNASTRSAVAAVTLREFAFVLHIDDDDFRAFVEIPLRYRLADAARGASHDRYLVLQFQGLSPGSFFVSPP